MSSAAGLQQRYYSRRRPRPRRMRPGALGPTARRHLQTALGLLAGSERRLLEIGAGMGRFSLPLADLGFEVVAADVSPDLLRALRDADPQGRIEILLGDATRLDPSDLGPGRSADAVVGFFCLHHLEGLGTALTSWRRLLPPGGRIAFVEPHALNPGYYAQVTLTPSMSWAAEKGLIGMREGRLRRLVEVAGFREIEIHTYGLLPPRLADHPLGRRLDAWLARLPLLDRARAYLALGASAA